jgi:hypothetical protein
VRVLIIMSTAIVCSQTTVSRKHVKCFKNNDKHANSCASCVGSLHRNIQCIIFRPPHIINTVIDRDSGVIELMLSNGTKTALVQHNCDKIAADATTTVGDREIPKLEVCWISLNALCYYRVSSQTNLSMQLEWVYGYRGKDCRSNLHTLPTGEILYNVGCVIVIHDIKKLEQRFYEKHTGEIKW